MKAREVVDLYRRREEFRVKVDFIDPGSLAELNEIPLETQVLLERGGRRRVVYLAFLKIAYDCNPEFARDYLDLDLSLNDIHEKYGVYTDLEYVALHCLHAVRDEDAAHALRRLKTFILSRKSSDHGL
ncbi:hypothetical protein [Metallosphaera javensis (ex Sakai et al. 2022)]|uniref:hypothetical protein n=1 Tax=Metallosphaera javensis (ex Sakai et al. 2022) TaxID=2775498 RepID=UPI00258E33E0|nr:MAG: hypothetical protein MjAS7_0272 [Metallosphaera javensis (ex Sakai et al. 2022)]